MIKVEIYKNSAGESLGFRAEGHAGFAESGSDIVCSAASVLMINTVNSIKDFTEAKFVLETDQENGGYLKFMLKGSKSEKAELILMVMEKGLLDMKKLYGEFIKVDKREVRK